MHNVHYVQNTMNNIEKERRNSPTLCHLQMHVRQISENVTKFYFLITILKIVGNTVKFFLILCVSARMCVDSIMRPATAVIESNRK